MKNSVAPLDVLAYVSFTWFDATAMADNEVGAVGCDQVSTAADGQYLQVGIENYLTAKEYSNKPIEER